MCPSPNDSSPYCIIKVVESIIYQKQPSGGQLGPHLDVSSSMGGSQFLPSDELNDFMLQLPALCSKRMLDEWYTVGCSIITTMQEIMHVRSLCVPPSHESYLAYRQTCTRHFPFLKSFSDSPHPRYLAGLHSLIHSMVGMHDEKWDHVSQLVHLYIWLWVYHWSWNGAQTESWSTHAWVKCAFPG